MLPPDIRMTPLPPLPPQPRVRGRKPHDPIFDVREALYYALGVDLTAIEGIDELHALTLVSALGMDFSKWPTGKQQVVRGPLRSGTTVVVKE